MADDIRLSTLLDKHGMSMTELARKIQCTPAIVSVWCKGLDAPTPAYHDKVVSVLGLTSTEALALQQRYLLGHWEQRANTGAA